MDILELLESLADDPFEIRTPNIVVTNLTQEMFKRLTWENGHVYEVQYRAGNVLISFMTGVSTFKKDKNSSMDRYLCGDVTLTRLNTH